MPQRLYLIDVSPIECTGFPGEILERHVAFVVIRVLWDGGGGGGGVDDVGVGSDLLMLLLVLVVV